MPIDIVSKLHRIWRRLFRTRNTIPCVTSRSKRRKKKERGKWKRKEETRGHRHIHILLQHPPTNSQKEKTFTSHPKSNTLGGPYFYSKAYLIPIPEFLNPSSSSRRRNTTPHGPRQAVVLKRNENQGHRHTSSEKTYLKKKPPIHLPPKKATQLSPSAPNFIPKPT